MEKLTLEEYELLVTRLADAVGLDHKGVFAKVTSGADASEAIRAFARANTAAFASLTGEVSKKTEKSIIRELSEHIGGLSDGAATSLEALKVALLEKNAVKAKDNAVVAEMEDRYKSMVKSVQDELDKVTSDYNNLAASHKRAALHKTLDGVKPLLVKAQKSAAVLDDPATIGLLIDKVMGDTSLRIDVNSDGAIGIKKQINGEYIASHDGAGNPLPPEVLMLNWLDASNFTKSATEAAGIQAPNAAETPTPGFGGLTSGVPVKEFLDKINSLGL